MRENFENSLMYTWLNKDILKSRVLDDMEKPSNWSIFGRGKAVLTQERSKFGKQSLKFETSLETDVEALKRQPMGRGIGYTGIMWSFDKEDWTGYNRISLWVYPVAPTIHTVDIVLRLYNDGKHSGYNSCDGNHVILQQNRWNHVVWEITDLKRDKVTGFAFVQRIQGYEPESEGIVTHYIDQLELQLVKPDKFEGWDVASGKIAYSHAGYKTNLSKIAIASTLPAKQFKVINQDTGLVVLEKQIKTVETRLGRFQILDFSEVTQPGTYILKVGEIQTKPFKIGEKIWRGSIWKVLNFFYCERCGSEIPGIHRICHRDWQGIHGEKKIIINSGWHDAGDLSQGLLNTTEAVWAMLATFESLTARDDDPELSERILEEALWGLEWILRNNFGNGYRVTWATMDRWTDGIIGNVDDVTAEAKNSPMHNFACAAVEALAYRLLKERNTDFARRCVTTAKNDWKYAVEKESEWMEDVPFQIHAAYGPYLTASLGILSSIEIFEALGDETYANKAVEYGRFLLNCQQRSFELDLPITGYFYTSPKKEFITSHPHFGLEHFPILALTRLCEAFPNHDDWVEWYASVVLHSEYFLKECSKYSAPYEVVPNSIRREDEYLQVPETDRHHWIIAGLPETAKELYRQQVLDGMKVGEKHYLRFFPVAIGPRGSEASLCHALALRTAAQLRGDLGCENLAQKQLEWWMGKNPFCQSLMYGEGYDYPPLFSAMSGNIVGALPVGFDSRKDDLPFWPAANYHNPKEVWVRSDSHFLWTSAHLSSPALVMGFLKPPRERIVFRDLRSGRSWTAEPDFLTGAFKIELPAGEYLVEVGDIQKELTLLSSELYRLEIDMAKNFSFSALAEESGDGALRLKVSVKGCGEHLFEIRAFNLELSEPLKKVNLDDNGLKEICWEAKVLDPKTPWIAVIIPDGKLIWRKELFGVVKHQD